MKRPSRLPASRSRAGANVLDVNMDEGMIDGPAAMTKFSTCSGRKLRCSASPL